MSLFRSNAAALAAAALLLAPAALQAQSGNSTLTGIVKDTSGGAILGAGVKIVNGTTTVSVDSITDQEGSYRVGALVPGPYRVEASLDGFETAVRRLVLEVGQTTAVDVTLTPARITEGWS